MGYYYVTRDTIIKEYGEVTPENIQAAEKRARAELETFGSYLSGENYGFTIEKDGEAIDSCWGYYGEEGIKDIEELFKETCPLGQKE